MNQPRRTCKKSDLHNPRHAGERRHPETSGGHEKHRTPVLAGGTAFYDFIDDDGLVKSLKIDIPARAESERNGRSPDSASGAEWRKRKKPTSCKSINK